MVTLVADLKKVHVAFDLSTEKFRVHEFSVNSAINLRGLLVDLGGLLCAIFSNLCEAWVIK